MARNHGILPLCYFLTGRITPPPEQRNMKSTGPLFAARAEWANMSGGACNSLGARVMELDDDRSRMNGANAPATVGTNVIFGCVRLGNDDVTDLYGRVKVGTLVLVD
jgi:lipoprotein-anchoring transpeptidase ErfK/SrfK